MRNKMMFLGVFAFVCMSVGASRADDAFDDPFDFDNFAATQDAPANDNLDENDELSDADMAAMSADAVSAYQVEGSLFQQITDLEQEKVLMQLEKERAQLDLELDRLAAEKIRLHMEIDTLSGRAEQAQAEIEAEKAKLEAEAQRLAREKENLKNQAESAPARRADETDDVTTDEDGVDLSESYRLVNVFGAGAQLQATVANLKTGQNKRIGVGKTLDGYTVKSISLDDGVVFSKDGITQSLNIGANR